MKTKKVYVIFVETEDEKEQKEVAECLLFQTIDLPVSVIQEEFNFSWKVKYWVENVVLTLQNFFMKFKNLHLYIF